ncbi:MAG: hypothetical protein ACRDKG_01745 [Actinomycetota bacterium]
MDVLTGTPPTKSEPRPRRRRVVILVVLALVLLTLGFGGGVVAYEPLREGSVGGLRGPSRIAHPAGVNEHPKLVTYESGARLEIEFSIRNEGLAGVTITGLVRPMVDPLILRLYEVREIRLGVLGDCCEEPFAAFALAPQEERIIQLRGELRGCGDFSPGSSTSWSSYEVSYRILGIPRTTNVDTSDPVIIEIPTDYRCDEPSRVPTS